MKDLNTSFLTLKSQVRPHKAAEPERKMGALILGGRQLGASVPE